MTAKEKEGGPAGTAANAAANNKERDFSALNLKGVSFYLFIFIYEMLIL